MPRTRRLALPLALASALAAASLPVAPLLPRHASAPPAGIPGAPLPVPDPPSWPLLATGVLALGGALAVRRRVA